MCVGIFEVVSFLCGVVPLAGLLQSQPRLLLLLSSCVDKNPTKEG